VNLQVSKTIFKQAKYKKRTSCVEFWAHSYAIICVCVVSVFVCACVCLCVCVLVWSGNITKKHFYSLLCYSQFSFLSLCPKPTQSRLHKEKFEIYFLSYYVRTSYTKNG